MVLTRQLQRVREELVGLCQHRNFLLERLINLDHSISQKEQFAQTLEQQIGAEALEAVRPGLRYGAIRTAILARLADEPNGLSGAQIGLMVRDFFGANVHAKSHFAALKRLVDDGLVIKDGRIWKLQQGPDSKGVEQMLTTS